MSSEPRPKIIIADDHPLVAEACKKLLEAEYDVVATVGDGRALVRVASTLKPQLIVIDVAMPLLNGLDAGQQIKQMLPSVKLVFLAMSQDADMAAEAFRRGASAYLLKTCAASELTAAVREVLKGRSYLSPAIACDTVDFLLRQGKVLVEEGDLLTEREREVLQLLAEGKSMKEIASVLNLTPHTVAFHKCRIMEALHVHTNVGPAFGFWESLRRTITAPPELTSVVVSPSEKTIAVNAVVTFIAMALDQNGVVIEGPVSFTWTSSIGGVVTPDSIQDDAPTGVSQVQFTGTGANQSTVITATATFNGKSALGGGAVTEVFSPRSKTKKRQAFTSKL